jgi:predicted dehydrogenase
VDNRHRLLFLDPGHFHAALTVRTPHPRVVDELIVYAPEGPERREFLALVGRFAHPWRVEVVDGSDPLGALIAQRRGDVVVLAGRNAGKARTMRALHGAGFHVLADKPWLVRPEDLEHIRAGLAGGALVAEIMTGRHDVGARLLKRLVDAPDVFGELRTDVPAIELSSVHHLAKLVNGAPLRRPAWYFDTRVQGSGLADTPTHLVDRAQWLVDRTRPRALPRLANARAWPTAVPLGAFRAITRETGFPDTLADTVDGDTLEYWCNGELQIVLDDVTARLRSVWNVETPPNGGDTSLALVRGTRADIRLEQSERTAYRRELVVLPRPDGDGDAVGALRAVIADAQAEWPGVASRAHADGGWEITIPAGLDGGHETHFAQVLDAFLTSVDAGELPRGAAERTLAKYEVLAAAVGATLRE